MFAPALRENNTNLVLLDADFCECDCVQLIREIRKLRPGLAVLVFAMRDDFAYGEQCLRAGAKGILMRSSTNREFDEAIDAVMRGRIFITKRLSEALVRKMIDADPISGTRARIKGLSDREFEVFSMIGAGNTTRGIAGDLGLSVKTIESHRSNIMRKLNLRNGVELAQKSAAWVETNN